jgi:hypothetical protein
MSVRTCLPGLVADGKVDPGRAARMLDMFDELERGYRGKMGAAAAEAQASRDVADALAAETAERRRQTVLQIRAQQRMMAEMKRAAEGGGRIDVIAAAHLDFDERAAHISNVESRRRAVLGRAHGMMNEVLFTFRKDILGRPREAAKLDNMAREAFGETTGDASARELAKAWAKTSDYLRQRFNAAGGHIAKRADWGLPQAHDSAKVRRASYAEWRDHILPRLDPERMIDELTGKPFSAERLELALRDVYETIRTDGWNKRAPGGAGGSKLANRRADHRFLVFRNADAWLEYQAQFGAGSTFDAMMGHLDGMARDIAAMEILGPNPNASVKWLGDLVEKASAGGEDKILDRARVARWKMDTVWSAYTGALNRPVNARVARGFATVRSLQTASKLGAAMLSAVSDTGFSSVTAKFNGLSATRVIRQLAVQLNPANAADRALAVRAGLIAEEAASRMGALWRYHDEFNTPEFARRLADGVLRASGLSAWTQAGKWAFGMEFMGTLGDNAGKRFDALDAPLQRALRRYGIGPDSWERIRAAPLTEHRGAKILMPDDIEDAALGERVLEMIQSETRFAVPEASLSARAVLTFGAQPGTFAGEFARSTMQFKAFPITILSTHVMRAVHQAGWQGRASYAAQMLIATTMMGALAYQLKQIAAGKDPIDMTGENAGQFWTAAALQGGGAGIIGDFLFADQNRYGGGLTATVAGPTLATAGDFLKLTVGNVQQLAAGDETHFGRELTKFVQANTPGQSLWYARTAFQRILFDNLQRMADPEADKAFRRLERFYEREYGQDYWWAPGEAAPDNLPQLQDAFGGDE